MRTSLIFLILNLLAKGLLMHKKLMIPGPTEVSQEILNEQAHLLIGHRGKEFSDLYAGITDKLSRYFELPDDVKATVTTSSGIFGLT